VAVGGVIALVLICVLVAVGFHIGQGLQRASWPSVRPSPSSPGGRVCSDDALLAMPVRDKLAQLLMVGVTGADDARAVVGKQHVGGIL
jgi:beta-N-acetylhexosaminidase